jgi:hypothetical protein
MSEPWRLPIPDDACAQARDMLAQGVNPDGVIEFMRGDVVCLRGTVRAFASRKFTEKGARGPRHVRYDPVEEQRIADLRVRRRPPVS